MNFVIKSTHLTVGKRPIHLLPLSALLTRFGIEFVRDRAGHCVHFGKHTRRSLWEVWDLVRAKWRELRRRLHPDVSGLDYSHFAVISSIHDMILKRLKSRGLPI